MSFRRKRFISRPGVVPDFMPVSSEVATSAPGANVPQENDIIKPSWLPSSGLYVDPRPIDIFNIVQLGACNAASPPAALPLGSPVILVGTDVAAFSIGGTNPNQPTNQFQLVIPSRWKFYILAVDPYLETLSGVWTSPSMPRDVSYAWRVLADATPIITLTSVAHRLNNNLTAQPIAIAPEGTTIKADVQYTDLNHYFVKAGIRIRGIMYNSDLTNPYIQRLVSR